MTTTTINSREMTDHVTKGQYRCHSLSQGGGYAKFHPLRYEVVGFGDVKPPLRDLNWLGSAAINICGTR